MLLLAGKLRPRDRVDGQRRHAHMAASRRALLLDVWRRVKQLGFHAKPVERLRKKSAGFRTDHSRIGQAAVTETGAIQQPSALRIEFSAKCVPAKHCKIAFSRMYDDLLGLLSAGRRWCFGIRHGPVGRSRLLFCSKLTKGHWLADC